MKYTLIMATSLCVSPTTIKWFGKQWIVFHPKLDSYAHLPYSSGFLSEVDKKHGCPNQDEKKGGSLNIFYYGK